MDILCLDLEGVLVPEVWQAVANETQIPQLLKTTRDIPNYDDLMDYRLGIIDQHGITLSQIQAEIAKLTPLLGARISSLGSTAFSGCHYLRYFLRIRHAPYGAT